jgi:Putative peptidoglycan binding domain
MKALKSLGLALAAALSLGLPKPVAAHGGGGFSGSHGYSGHSGFVAHSGGSYFHAPASGFHGPAPAYRSATGSHAPAVSFYTAPRSGGVKTPTFAFGGHLAAPAGKTTQRPTGGWDRHWDRIWHGHHYHWNDGAWVIVNDGYYPWDDSYYVPASPDVYPDMSYDYGDSPSNAGAPNPPPSVAAGSASPTNSESIAGDVQQALASRGYYDGQIDGMVGDGTRQAIADFQKDNNLPITGYITKSLLTALGL